MFSSKIKTAEITPSPSSTNSEYNNAAILPHILLVVLLVCFISFILSGCFWLNRRRKRKRVEKKNGRKVWKTESATGTHGDIELTDITKAKPRSGTGSSKASSSRKPRRESLESVDVAMLHQPQTWV
jgi:FtsZ-interacting cell division protein ZipA